MPARKIGVRPVVAGRPGDETVARSVGPGALDALPGIYRAALDDDEWPVVLRQLADDFASPFAALVTIDKVRDRAALLRFSEPDAVPTHGRAVALEPYAVAEDLLYQATRNDPPGSTFRGDERVPFETLRTSPLYHAVLKPRGVRYSLCAMLESDDRYYTCFGFWYGRLAPSRSERVERVLGDLLPHLSAAVRVNRRLREAQAAHWAALYSMQFSRHGMLMLNHRRQLAFANREAERILRSRDGIAVDKGRVVFGDTGAQEAFDQFVGVPGATLPDDLEHRLRVPRPSRHLPFDVLVLPRLSRPDYWRFPEGTAFVVVVSDPAEAFAISKATLVGHYGLTSSEADLCRALIRHGDLARAADDCVISSNTARTHLKRVFAKLRVSSQLQLLQWLGSSIRPPTGVSIERAMLRD